MFRSVTVLTYIGTEFKWVSRKHSLVALFTSEAEYVALASAVSLITTIKMMFVAAVIMKKDELTVKRDNTKTCDMISKPNGTKRR